MSPCRRAILPFSAAVDTACIHYAIARYSFCSAEGAEAHTSPQVGRESDVMIQHVEAVQYDINNQALARLAVQGGLHQVGLGEALFRREAMIGICELDCFRCTRAPFRLCSSDKANVHQFFLISNPALLKRINLRHVIALLVRMAVASISYMKTVSKRCLRGSGRRGHAPPIYV